MWDDDLDGAAAELYDAVVRDLYSAGLTLYGVAASLGPGPLTERLRSATAGLDDAIRRLRPVAIALRDHPVTDTGRFATRLFDTIAAVAPGLPAAPTTRIAGPVGDLPEGVVDDLLAVVGEVLTSVARHARARTVEVAVTVTEGGVSLRVTGDGVGPAGIPDGDGLGALTRRAEERGGSLVADPAPSGGAQLVWAVPLP
ncbi:sensor histidine kinase [Geodermatophilus sp. SYSU D00758]